jgi:hypothetical protein
MSSLASSRLSSSTGRCSRGTLLGDLGITSSCCRSSNIMLGNYPTRIVLGLLFDLHLKTNVAMGFSSIYLVVMQPNPPGPFMVSPKL